MNSINCEYNYTIQCSGIMNTKVSKIMIPYFQIIPRKSIKLLFLSLCKHTDSIPDICMYIYALPFSQRFNLCKF